MALIFITGNSGAGKSSVRRELQKRGYEAHDTDEDGISLWYHKATGEATNRPVNEADRTKEWYEKHDWNMSRQRIKELSAKSKKKIIFLCGATSNAPEMLDVFDKVIYLKVDEDTLRSRLKNRTDNDFGKAPDELSNILSWHKWMEETYGDKGAVLVDSTQPVAKVVDEILNKLNLPIRWLT